MSRADPPDLPPADAPEPTAEARRRDAYIAAVKGYGPGTIARLCAARDPEAAPANSARLLDLIGRRGAVEAALEGTPAASRLVLGIFGATEAASLPASGVRLTLRALGIEPAGAIGPLLRSGLLAARPPDPGPPIDLDAADPAPDGDLSAHPEAVSAGSLRPPDGPAAPAAGPAALLRETDGLEPILRLAALWQRVRAAPLRRTQQGTFFKRDRERVADDAALAGPIADALEPLPDQVALWLALAEGVGLIARERDGERLLAAPADFWSEHAVHLPQMLGLRWIGLDRWHEQGGWQEDGAPARLAAPFARLAALLTLARQGPGEWTALEDLESHLDALEPGWSRPALDLPAPEVPSRRGGRASKPAEAPGGLLGAILLGPAYQLGLVRAAEEGPARRRLVQLTDSGRYVLGLGPPPAPRETFEEFLFVQPNFEVIAYRQGLNPWLAGLLGRFLDWVQIGSALEMRLSAESVYRGLEGGLTADSILGRLERHSGRRLPSGVQEALRTWSGRRARLAYYAEATLIEFAEPEDLEATLAAWAEDPDRPAPIRAGDRLLLVADGSGLPRDRVRIVGSRDYRGPAEPCVEVGPGGVELAVDVGRSDLFVESELARLAEPVSDRPARARGESDPRRRYRITPASLGRALSEGMTPGAVERWFAQRTGTGPPPAVRLLLLAAGTGAREPLRAARPVVLRAPTSEHLEGMLQHPATSGLLGERLGPETVIVREGRLEALREALRGLGLACEVDEPGS